MPATPTGARDTRKDALVNSPPRCETDIKIYEKRLRNLGTGVQPRL